MKMQAYCDVNRRTFLKRTSPEVKCLHPTSSKRDVRTSSFSNVIYHKFTHVADFYTLNGKNVNVMLEYNLFIYLFNVWLHGQCNGVFQRKISVHKRLF